LRGKSVSVAVKSSAQQRFESGIMPGTWLVQTAGTTAKPWQLVDDYGKRTIYRCGS